MKPFYFKDHTADIQMVVEAGNIEGLFRNSGKGLASQLFSSDKEFPSYKIIKKDFSINSPSLQDLFIDWLNELLYYFYTGHILFKDVKFSSVKMDSIKGVLDGYLIPVNDRILSREIKAATYHDLIVKKEKNRFKAQVIFDV